MSPSHLRTRLVLFGVTLTAVCVLAADLATVQRIGPPESLSDALRLAVEDKGYRVTLDDGWSVEFWFAKQLKLEKKETPGALYPDLPDGEFVALANFPQGMSDYRGQQIPAGFYTLRYQTIPQDGNHLGVSPNPDFLLAIPAASDPYHEQNYGLTKRLALSRRSTDTGHPGVIAMDAAGHPGAVTKNDRGYVMFNVAVPADEGKTETLGIVLKGTAA